ncbi:hypothetical protein M405DRAFT_808911 [Rhizopogon salebrosus TDB-379]|nr:hypothetical protein M405DRAFT_808911 [Rhizopogon salebrosus TDB-379]
MRGMRSAKTWRTSVVFLNTCSVIGNTLRGASACGRRYGVSIAFDGCRPVHRWIEDQGGWIKDEGGVREQKGESEESLFWCRVGRLVKAG